MARTPPSVDGGMARLSREHRVLLDCITCERWDSKSDLHRRSDRQDPIDWSVLVRLAEAHGVLPLVAKQLHAVASAPEHVQRDLARAASQVAARNLQLTGELISIARTFGSAGIDMLPVKGPVLAQYVYGDVGLRVFGDLDIVVRERDLSSALELLALRGYDLPHRGMSRRNAAHAATFGHFSARRADIGLTVEVHPQLVDPRFGFRVRNDDLFNRAEFITIADQRMRTLSRQDLLLYLCIHGSKHAFSRIEWVVAIGILMQQGGFEFAGLLDSATRVGGARRLLLGMLLANRLCGAPLTDQARRAIEADKTVPFLATKVCDGLFAATAGTDSAAESIALRIGFHTRAFDRVTDRLRYVYRCVVEPSEVEFTAFDLPDRLTPLYTPLRLARLAMRAIGGKKGR
ncbi:MAG: nucleotidyltransferase family protein [Gemmatimonas sp.]